MKPNNADTSTPDFQGAFEVAVWHLPTQHFKKQKETTAQVHASNIIHDMFVLSDDHVAVHKKRVDLCAKEFKFLLLFCQKKDVSELVCKFRCNACFACFCHVWVNLVTVFRKKFSY